MSNIEYYIVEFKFAERSYYTLWFSDEEDGFYISGEKVLAYLEKADIWKFALSMKMNISDEETIIDCDYISNWFTDNKLNSEYVLNFWNICSDMAMSIGIDFIGSNKEYNDIYNKVFRSCTELMEILDSEYIVQTWSKVELQILEKVLKEGTNILYNALR